MASGRVEQRGEQRGDICAGLASMLEQKSNEGRCKVVDKVFETTPAAPVLD